MKLIVPYFLLCIVLHFYVVNEALLLHKKCQDRNRGGWWLIGNIQHRHEEFDTIYQNSHLCKKVCKMLMCGKDAADKKVLF